MTGAAAIPAGERPASGTTDGPPRIGPIGWLSRRLKSRPDSEHEQCLVRLALGVFIIAYCFVLGLEAGYDDRRVIYPIWISIIGFAAAVPMFLAVVIWPKASPIRRYLGILIDSGSLSLFLYYGGELTAPFYPIYLWITLGYGFRYGPRYLLVTGALSLAGFSAVISVTPFWSATAPHLAVGLLMGLIMVPAYSLSLLKKLTRAKAMAEEASQAKSRFLANMSHELRTPLTAVIGVSDLLRDQIRDNDQREMVATIKTAARTLLHLINEILDFSKIEAGKMTVQVEDFDLHEMLASLMSIVDAQAVAKGVMLNCHFDRGVPRYLRGDANHLRQVLLNLLGNAVKFTDRGAITASVSVTGHGEGETALCFEIKDTGIGIPADRVGRIFDSFTQGDDSIARRFGGTGLGLSIVRQIVEILGGRITVDSAEGQGSTFRIWMTLAHARDLDQGHLPDNFFDGAFVAIVSDEEDFALGAADTLRNAGATVRVVPNMPQLIRVLGDRPNVSANRPSVAVIDSRSISASIGLVTDGLYSQFTRRKLKLILASDFSVANQERDFTATIATTAGSERVLDAVHAALVGSQPEITRAPSGEKLITMRRDKARLSILLVEDNLTNSMVLTKILERAGYRVTLTDNVDDGLDWLDRETFDLVITDLNLPGTSGLDFVKMHRITRLDGPRLPFIAVTADATPEAREKCLAAGMDAVISKPIDAVQLLAQVETILPDGEPEGSVRPQGGAAGLVNIAQHPRFHQATDPILDTAALAELHALGGTDGGFFRDLVADFLGEAETLLTLMGDAADAGDVAAFRSHAHALRGSLADIGARRLYARALEFRSPSHERLKREGKAQVAEMRADFEKLRHVLLVEARRLDPGLDPEAKPSFNR